VPKTTSSLPHLHHHHLHQHHHHQLTIIIIITITIIIKPTSGLLFNHSSLIVSGPHIIIIITLPLTITIAHIPLIAVPLGRRRHSSTTTTGAKSQYGIEGYCKDKTAETARLEL
jgi:hypothetical protein